MDERLKPTSEALSAAVAAFRSVYGAGLSRQNEGWKDNTEAAVSAALEAAWNRRPAESNAAVKDALLQAHNLIANSAFDAENLDWSKSVVERINAALSSLEPNMEREPVAWRWRQLHNGKWGNWNLCWNQSSLSDNSEYWRDLAAKCPNEVQVAPLFATPPPDVTAKGEVANG
jgi:hypothetical protein